MKVEKKHAFIKRQGQRYVLVNNGAPVEFTRVNDSPVSASCELHDGDRIQLGNVALKFQMRVAKAWARKKLAAPAAAPAVGILEPPRPKPPGGK